MRRSLFFVPVMAFLAISVLGLVSCGGSGGKTGNHSPDTSVVGPAPDNNSANNPSLADTNYEKNRTRPITDTMKNK
jgi:hypothetical protein